MPFLNDDHKKFFETQLEKTNCIEDKYRKAFFYTLGLTEETRNHINSLYDYENNCISFDGLYAGWQTGTSMKVTHLAFNLYNGFLGQEGDEREYTPYTLFCCGLLEYMLVAVRLLYPCYTKETI